MSRVAPRPVEAGNGIPRWLAYAVILGLYLSLRGYHSLDSDQTYRLPLLLHQEDPSLYADDPFVRAFDAFNPHRGSLLAMSLVTRPLGLSAGLFLIFTLTFGATCLGLDRLARTVWPELGPAVGLTALGLLLAAKAGNIGTNHLFEAMVLDRLMSFALAWLALAMTVAEPNRPPWRAMAAIALATVLHPSLGLQLALMLAASWLLWAVLGQWSNVSVVSAVRGVTAMATAVLPGLAINIAPGSSLRGTMPADEFWLLSVELQGPQHMLPHLWRMPQWLAWGCYFVLVALAIAGPRRARPGDTSARESVRDLPERWPAARLRLVAVLAVILIGLAAGWTAIEGFHQVACTVFQPFRMATVARGIALVFIAGRLVTLWRRGDALARLRAILLAVALSGDWLFVVVSLAELAVSAAEAVRARLPGLARWRFIEPLTLLVMLAVGLNFLGHHDTEYGNRTLAATLGIGLIAGVLKRLRQRAPDSSRHLPEPNFPPLVKGGAGGGGPDAVADTAVPSAVALFGFTSDAIPSPLTRPAGILSPSERGEKSQCLVDEPGDDASRSPSPQRGEGRGEGAEFGDGFPPHPPWPPLVKGGKETLATRKARAWIVFRGITPHPPLPPLHKAEKNALAAPTIRRDVALVGWLLGAAWLVPLAAFLAGMVPLDHPAAQHPLVHGLVSRCRFTAVPADDIERLGLWCREHTPPSARFIGPPGPKTFRLWSRRSLAFNRAASPYHADGLADWFARFQDHVAYHGPPAEFVHAYVNNRHGYEARYQSLSDTDRAALAVRQGANHVIAAAPSIPERTASTASRPLELLHVEGRLAVYRVNPDRLAQRQR